MNRRKLLKAATLAAASGAISAPAIAQSAPALRWRLATTFPKSLDTLYGACEMFSKAIAELSDQKFQIGVFGPGEIVPPFQVLDAVGNNTVEMGNSLLLLHRQGSGVCIRNGRSVWAQHAADERMARLRRRP
jgi:TRAP-type mannitol/chloroaromatic compound transport system substrate-binding protein